VNILDEVLTVNEVSKILNVTPRQVQRMCKAGKLTTRYADGIWLILKSSVKSSE
jgi:chemotaxis signal transduction protein